MRIQLEDRELDVSPVELEAIKDKCTIATGDHLARFAAHWGLTLSEAWQLWVATDWILEHHKNRHGVRAEVAYHYKLDSFKLDDWEVLALREHLPRLRSLQRIESRKYDPLDHDTVYRIWLEAYGDEDLARKRQSESFALYVDAKTKSG